MWLSAKQKAKEYFLFFIDLDVRNNKILSTSKDTLLQDNTLFNYEIKQINRLNDMVAYKANKLRVKASKISNNIYKYKEYLSEV